MLFYRPRHQIGWIWPKDPQSGNPLKWPMGRRLKDVLTNKGPDMFIGRIDRASPTPHTPRWSRWHDIYSYPGDGDKNMLPPILPFSDRKLQRYDFRTRKYRNVDEKAWSFVEYPDPGETNSVNTPVTVWDVNGIKYSYPHWQLHYGEGFGNAH